MDKENVINEHYLNDVYQKMLNQLSDRQPEQKPPYTCPYTGGRLISDSTCTYPKCDCEWIL